MSSLIRKETPVVANLYSLADIAAEGDKIIAAAEQRAREIEESACQRGVAMAKQQAQEGYRTGYQSGMQEGEAAARKEATAAVTAETRDRFAQLAHIAEKIIGTMEAERHAVYADAANAIVALAVAIASRVCKTTAANTSEVTIANAQQLLASVRTNAPIVLEVSEADCAELQQQLPILAQRGSEDRDIQVTADATLNSGDVRLRYEHGTIDGSIETQLERVAQAILSQPQADGEKATS